ncbi:MAG: FAD-dependent monooxygenase [Steroidobacteraceae bacterium]
MHKRYTPGVKAESRAIVIGGSMAGLLAARILSEHYAEVLLFERDELPDGPLPRKGTPHALHAHGLLARGREVLESLFPGYTASLEARAAIVGDIHADVALEAAGRRFINSSSDDRGLCCSRLLIEDELRRRVRALPNVCLLTQAEVIEPIYDGASERVTGVVAFWRTLGSQRRYAADLVIDATGRGSRLPTWLRLWGYEPPHEDRVTVGFSYITAYYERRAEHTPLLGVLGSATPEAPFPGIALAQEPVDSKARWVVTLGAYGGERLQASEDGMRQRALRMGVPELIRITHEAKLIGTVLRYGFPSSQRRRYERMQRFPSGLLAVGDAIASFNPVYGQGMTVAACQAFALRKALRAPERKLAKRFFAAAARIIDTPWQIAVGADLAIPSVEGERPFSVSFRNRYLQRVFLAASRDARVARAFRRVTHLLAPPGSLMCPRVLLRVCWQSRSAPEQHVRTAAVVALQKVA